MVTKNVNYHALADFRLIQYDRLPAKISPKTPIPSHPASSASTEFNLDLTQNLKYNLQSLQHNWNQLFPRKIDNVGSNANHPKNVEAKEAVSEQGGTGSEKNEQGVAQILPEAKSSDSTHSQRSNLGISNEGSENQVLWRLDSFKFSKFEQARSFNFHTCNSIMADQARRPATDSGSAKQTEGDGKFRVKRLQEHVYEDWSADKKAPTAPSAAVKDMENLTLTRNQYLVEVYKRLLQTLFQTHAIWKPSRLLSELQKRLSRLEEIRVVIIDMDVLSVLIPNYAYRFSKGPFRGFWIAYGSDPRRESVLRQYQGVELHIPKEICAYLPLRGDKTDSKRKQNYLDILRQKRQNHPQNSDPGTAMDQDVIGEMNGKLVKVVGKNKVNALKNEKEDLFQVIPTVGKIRYMLKDIANREIQELVGQAPISASCTVGWGWYKQKDHLKIRKLMKLQLAEWIRKSDYGVPAHLLSSYLSAKSAKPSAAVLPQRPSQLYRENTRLFVNKPKKPAKAASEKRSKRVSKAKAKSASSSSSKSKSKSKKKSKAKAKASKKASASSSEDEKSDFEVMGGREESENEEDEVVMMSDASESQEPERPAIGAQQHGLAFFEEGYEVAEEEEEYEYGGSHENYTQGLLPPLSQLNDLHDPTMFQEEDTGYGGVLGKDSQTDFNW